MRDALEETDAWFRLAGWFAKPAGRALERRLRAGAPKARPVKVGMALRAGPYFPLVERDRSETFSRQI